MWVVIIVCLAGAIYAPSVVYKLSNGLVMEHSGVDVGHVKKGAIINHDFYLCSTALRYQMISYVETSCLCSIGTVSTYKLAPFRKAKITIVIDTNKVKSGKNMSGLRVHMSSGRVLDWAIVKFTVDPQRNERDKIDIKRT
jgi:hypothetical protein